MGDTILAAYWSTHAQLYSSRVNASAKMMNVAPYGMVFEKIIHLLGEERRDLRPRKG